MENASSFQSFRLEPTVFGAVRRFWAMVLVIAVLAAAAAAGYALMQKKTYRAQASITVPREVSLQGQDPAQYLDSQVLLLRSPALAAQAAGIANAALHSAHLSATDFYGSKSFLSITPPTGASPGVYGASIVLIAFTWRSPQIAQAGVNAVLQAFDDVRSAAITSQADAIVAGIDQTLQRTSDQGQRTTLLGQRTQTLLNEQIDLAHQPTVAEAGPPTAAASGGWKRAAAIGLVIGIILGAALAYARANIRRSVAGRREPEEIYGARLLGEVPALRTGKTSPRDGSRAAALLPVASDPDSPAAEAFRFAAGSIEHVRSAQGNRLVLAFVSPLAGAGKSTVVANLALAIAEGRTRVLVVDAGAAGDTGDHVTGRLLPGVPAACGFEQVLAGQRGLTDCIQLSPLNDAVAVLGCGAATPSPVRGAARSKTAGLLLAEARACFDVVLIDTPAFLHVADATELVGASDAAVVVVNPDEPIQVHLELAERLKLAGPGTAGYILNRAPMKGRRARARRSRSSGRRPLGPAGRAPALDETRPLTRVSLLPPGPTDRM